MKQASTLLPSTGRVILLKRIRRSARTTFFVFAIYLSLFPLRSRNFADVEDVILYPRIVRVVAASSLIFIWRKIDKAIART